MNVQAHRLAHDPKILAASREEAEKRIHSGAILGASILVEIARNSQHKDQFKAACALLNRSGLHERTEHKVTHEHSAVGLIDEVKELAKLLGVDPEKLLGKNTQLALPSPGEIVEGEFVEVTEEEVDDTSSLEGLEDVL